MIGAHPFGAPYFGGAAEVATGGIKTGAASMAAVSTWTASGQLASFNVSGGVRYRPLPPKVRYLKLGRASIRCVSEWTATGTRLAGIPRRPRLTPVPRFIGSRGSMWNRSKVRAEGRPLRGIGVSMDEALQILSLIE